MVGVCSYGVGGTKDNNKLGRFDIRELNRLVIEEGLGKNACSFFISKTFKLLPSPLVLISYSDLNYNHHGYIYQATNWLYTGLSRGRNLFVDKEGIEIHEKTIWDRFHTNKSSELEKLGYKRIKKLGKHRYFLGNKNEKKEMLKELLKRFKIQSYPKGNNINYNSSSESLSQYILF